MSPLDKISEFVEHERKAKEGPIPCEKRLKMCKCGVRGYKWLHPGSEPNWPDKLAKR